MAKPTLIECMWSKFIRTPDGCWEWIGERTAKGYGRVTVRDQGKLAHKVMYETLVETTPDGLELDHLCRNRACVNPAHLEPVTHAENIRRGDTGKHNAAKTHCPYGHEYSEENTHMYNGKRHCRACKRRRNQMK